MFDKIGHIYLPGSPLPDVQVRRNIRHYPAEYLTYLNAVNADGGEIGNSAKVLRDIELLKTMEVYNNLVLGIGAEYGFKKDGSGNISKLFNLANANNVEQNTLANQPNLSTSPNRIVANGTTDNYNAGNPSAFQITAEQTVIIICKAGSETPGATQAILRKGSATGNKRAYYIFQVSGSSNLVGCTVSADGGATNIKEYRQTVANWHTTFKAIAFTFKSNSLKTYIDYVDTTVGATKTLDGTVNNIYNTSDPLGLFAVFSDTTPSSFSNHEVKSFFIFNKELTGAQMTAISGIGV